MALRKASAQVVAFILRVPVQERESQHEREKERERLDMTREKTRGKWRVCMFVRERRPDRGSKTRDETRVATCQNKLASYRSSQDQAGQAEESFAIIGFIDIYRSSQFDSNK